MHPSRTRPGVSGFTLIELLTVIAIIAILMGLLLPALNAAKNAARRAQAKNDLSQFVTAVKSYQTDYGTYPIDPSVQTGLGGKDIEYGASSDQYHNADVVNVLRADPTDALSSGALPNTVNTRQVVYLDVPMVKDSSSPKSGLFPGGASNGTANGKPGDWYDPWGVPYMVAMDANYDNYVGVSGAPLFTYIGGSINYVTPNGLPNSVQTGCVAGSFGADHIQGSKNTPGNFNNSDDVLSWQ